MTMRPWRRHQRGDLRDQFEWRQHQRRRACAGRCCARRLGIAVDQMLGIALVQIFEGERRTGTVAQQTFEPNPVGALDAHRAIHREAAVVCPGAHLGGVIFVDQAAPDEGAQNTGSHARLYIGKRRRVEFVGKGGMKGGARRLVRSDGRFEDAVDDAAMKMDVLVQAGAETVDEGDRSDPRGGGSSRAMVAQAAFRHGEENAQHGALQGRIALKEVTQPLGYGEHPLAHR